MHVGSPETNCGYPEILNGSSYWDQRRKTGNLLVRREQKIYFFELAWKYLRKVLQTLCGLFPLILFGKGGEGGELMHGEECLYASSSYFDKVLLSRCLKILTVHVLSLLVRVLGAPISSRVVGKMQLFKLLIQI